jgi:hypothetical protein
LSEINEFRWINLDIAPLLVPLYHLTVFEDGKRLWAKSWETTKI